MDNLCPCHKQRIYTVGNDISHFNADIPTLNLANTSPHAYGPQPQLKLSNEWVMLPTPCISQTTLKPDLNKTFWTLQAHVVWFCLWRPSNRLQAFQGYLLPSTHVKRSQNFIHLAYVFTKRGCLPISLYMKCLGDFELTPINLFKTDKYTLLIHSWLSDSPHILEPKVKIENHTFRKQISDEYSPVDHKCFVSASIPFLAQSARLFRVGKNVSLVVKQTARYLYIFTASSFSLLKQTCSYGCGLKHGEVCSPVLLCCF